MKGVLHVSCARDPRGRTGEALLDAWPTLGAVAAAVAAAGAEVTVLQASHRHETLARDGVTFRFVAGGARHLARAAAALRPTVLHLHGLHFPLHARALGHLDAPLLVQDHAGAPSRLRAPIHRWGLARADGVAFTARAQAEPFRRAGILRPGVPVFEIAESSTHFTPGDRAEARARTGLHGGPALLWVARLNENKDPLTVLDAVSQAARRMPDVRLWCCFTEAPLLERVRARLAAEPTLAERVHLLGAVPRARVELLCRAADLFVLGSRREGSGFALLEALACGTPAVVSDIPPFRALTADGAAGALVPPGDAAAFARAIVALWLRPPEAREEARRRVAAHFRRELSFAVLGRRLVEAYEALVRGRRGG